MKASTRGLLTVAATVISGCLLACICGFGTATSAWILVVCIITAIVQFFFFIAPGLKYLDVCEARAKELLKRIGSKSLAIDKTKDANLFDLLSEIEKTVIETPRKERAAVENAVDVICVIDTDGKILSANQAACSVWGYNQDELLGHNITEFILADTVAESLKPFLGAEKSIDKIFVENCFRKKNGEVIDLLWSAHWSASDSGLFCIAHDITQRKRSEKILAESERRVRLILESVPAGIAIINRLGYFEFMNKTSLDLVQYDLSSLQGLSAHEVFPFVKAPFRISSFIEIASDETKIVNSTGKHIPCELSVKEFNWNDSQVALVIILDLSDKYAVEQARREFIAMVSHDLRGPLTSINMVLNLINDGKFGELSDPGKRLANKTTKESIRLIQMINELLDIEKMKSGRFVSNLAEANVKELAKGAIDVVEQSASMQKIGISLTGDDCVCVCDGARIIQVFVNLLDNAIKYTQPGQEVRVLLEKQERGCHISVCNNGRLIPPNKLKSIFESFEQVKPSAVTERKGTGLGLAICKSIVEQHGEKIWVESASDIGTKFTFSLGTVELSLAELDNIEDAKKSLV